MVRGHYEAMLSFYGDDLGTRVARKHLGWYMDSCGTDAGLAPRGSDRSPIRDRCWHSSTTPATPRSGAPHDQ